MLFVAGKYAINQNRRQALFVIVLKNKRYIIGGDVSMNGRKSTEALKPMRRKQIKHFK